MTKYTIEQVIKLRDNMYRNKDEACREFEHDCRGCRYEGRCSSEISHFEDWLQRLLKEQCSGNCRGCKYLSECTAYEATRTKRQIEDEKRERERDETCKNLGTNCLKCRYFADKNYIPNRCNKPQASDATLLLDRACEANADDCKECEYVQSCPRDMAKNYRWIKYKLRKSPVDYVLTESEMSDMLEAEMFGDLDALDEIG